MPVIGEPRTFHHRYRFVVEVDGITSAGFQKCSELMAEVAEVAYSEGGSLIPVKAAGRVTFSDITLERGAVTDDADMYSWFLETVSAANSAGLANGQTQGVGLNDPEYKRNITIVQLDRSGARVRQWTLFNGWVKQFSAGDWDNEADEVLIEKLTLAYDYFERTL